MFGLPQEIVDQIFIEVRNLKIREQKFKLRIKCLEAIWIPTIPCDVFYTEDGMYTFQACLQKCDLCWTIALKWGPQRISSFCQQYISAQVFRTDHHMQLSDIFTYTEEFDSI
jgi:hypothetical protein